jgi:hypothetical protein
MEPGQTEGENYLRQSLQTRESAFGADSLAYAESKPNWGTRMWRDSKTRKGRLAGCERLRFGVAGAS